MKSKAYVLSAVAALMLAASIGAAAQESVMDRFDRSGGSVNFRGQINAYSPQTATTGTAGPYEIRGPWSLKLKQEQGVETADFSAAVNMELSDG
jgi:hypothetical protein